MKDNIVVRTGLVAVGGAAGVLLRFTAGHLFVPSGEFPFTTLTINVSGAFILAALVAASAATSSKNAQRINLLLGTGLMGGFTTYSGLALEGAELLSGGQTLIGFGYLLVTVLLGLIATAAGWKLGQVLEHKRREGFLQ